MVEEIPSVTLYPAGTVRFIVSRPDVPVFWTIKVLLSASSP